MQRLLCLRSNSDTGGEDDEGGSKDKPIEHDLGNDYG
jgi:hypothetical protein